MKTVVILGASYAGVSTAHRLLKQTAKSRDLKITLVSPNTHFYWNIASTRAMVPGQLSDESIFEPIAPGFKQYTADVFEFVIGSAQSLDIDAKRVTVAASNRQLVLNYDILILATGSQTKGDVPLKGRGSYDATRDALHDFQQRVKKAGSICIAGAGATGVELAGELGFEFGTKKKITLIGSGAQLLEGTPASVAKTAMQQLQSLHVDIKLKTKVDGSAKISGGQTELTLSNGEKIVTDLYLPTVGLFPNSSYVPQHLLNANGFVMVDKYLRVKDIEDIWAVGDIADVQRPQYVNTEKQSIHLVKNIILVLHNKEPVLYNPGSSNMLAVPIGRKAGTGHMGSWKLPSFMVNMVKGKTLFADKMRPIVSGSAF